MTVFVDSATEREPYGAMFNTDEIQRAARETGSHFFDADTMRFFASRVLSGVYGGRFFVTSEKTGFDSTARAYTVREFMPDGSIETVGEFNDYATSAQARGAAQRAAKSDVHSYYFDGQHGRGGRARVYVVTASDPWEAMARLHKNFRVRFCGRAKDYMLDGSRSHYVVIP